MPERGASTTLHVRPARVEEARALSELCLRSKAALGYDETFMALSRVALEVTPEDVAAGDVWVAVDARGATVGVVALGPGERSDTLDLAKLFVEPDRMRTGAGRLLLARAVAEAGSRRARRLTILSDPQAAPFYERHGARLIGEAPSDAVPGRFLPLYEIDLDRRHGLRAHGQAVPSFDDNAGKGRA